MINEVQSAINSLSASPVPVQSAVGLGRLFELYVMTGIAEKLSLSGWNVSLLRSDGIAFGPGDTFIQRGGKPTGVAPSSNGPNGQSSILIQNPATGVSWEIWNGIQFRGRSNALHEFDVSIVPHQLAVDLRALTQESFPFGRPVVAIECKDVFSPGSPDEMRTLVARLYDVSIIQYHTFLTGGAPVHQIYAENAQNNGHLAARRTYRDLNFATKSVLARTSGFSSGAVKMTSYYCISPYASITPGSAASSQFFEDLAHWISSNL